MATIETQIRLVENMTRPLQSIIKSLNMTVSMMRSVETAGKSAFKGSEIAAIQKELVVANSEMVKMTEDIGNNIKQQEKFNQTVKQGASQANSLGSSIKKIGGAYLGLQGVSKVLDLSDSMSQTNARLTMLVGGDTSLLEKQIFESAQRSRADYMQTADVITKMGTQASSAFKGNDELIQFNELLNKQFVIAGNNAAQIESVYYNLTQAMASGVLRGQDLNAVMSNTPQIAQAIADYLEVDIGQIKDLAANGEITAQIVKEAMLANGDDINASFEKMPWTFAQAMIEIKNSALRGIQPILNVIAQGAKIIHDNWSIIRPIIMGVVTAIGLYIGALGLLKAKELALIGIKKLHTVLLAIQEKRSISAGLASLFKAKADTTGAAAQGALNTALLASPITWVIGGIIAIIAILYAVVAAINRVTGSTYSATEMIKGSIAVAIAFIKNILVGIGDFIFSLINSITNRFAVFANFLANIFQNPISSIIYLFAGMADSVLGILQGIASAIDSVFGSNLSNAVSGWRDGLSGKADALVAKMAPNENYQKKFSGTDLNMANFGIQRTAYADAWENGKNFTISSTNALLGNALNGFGNLGMAEPDTLNDIAEIAKNTGRMSDSISATGEELKYLRDLAEQDTINRFTTAEIVVNLGGVNQVVNNEADLDGITDYLVENLEESMGMVAEGVYN